MTVDNLQLWNSVRTPDPAHTKSFSRGLGFKGTATNAVYLIRCATERWGPMGGKWGVTIVKEQYVHGAPMSAGDATGPTEIVHTIQIELRHPDGVVPAIGQTMFVGKNKNGMFTDEEAPKKSLTDALTKALSWLGFAADIHLGLWDDNKYVADVRQQYEDARREEDQPRRDPALLTDAQLTALGVALEEHELSADVLLTRLSQAAKVELLSLSDIPQTALPAIERIFKKRRESLAGVGDQPKA